jgi:hypothetical protein
MPLIVLYRFLVGSLDKEDFVDSVRYYRLLAFHTMAHATCLLSLLYSLILVNSSSPIVWGHGSYEPSIPVVFAILIDMVMVIAVCLAEWMRRVDMVDFAMEDEENDPELTDSGKWPPTPADELTSGSTAAVNCQPLAERRS